MYLRLRSLWLCCLVVSVLQAGGQNAAESRHSVSLPRLGGEVLDALQKQPEGDAKGRFQAGVGRFLEQPISITKDSAGWTDSTNGVWSCSFELEVSGALGMRIHLENISLPNDARILVYDEQHSGRLAQMIDNASLVGAKELWTETQFCERLVISCQAAAESDLQNIAFTVRELSHIYRLPLMKSVKEGACENDVTCYPEWAQEAAAVARMMFVDRGQTYVCTGCLLATTKPSSKDYFLTARHCITSPKVASTIELFWMYQTSSCDGDPPSDWSVPHTGGGADMVASGMPSDFAFLRLRQAAPSEAFHALWTTIEAGVGDAVATMHHPAGSFKRISFGNVIASDTYSWGVQWSSGVTEYGSSGSPLFNANHELIGQLAGGFNGPGSSCDNPSAPDQYSRFDVTYDSIKAWIGNGFTSNGFKPAKARFSGLFMVAGDESNPASSGAFFLATTAKGRFSGKLQTSSETFSFSGELDANGAGRGHVLRGMLSPWDMRFQIEATTQHTLSGTVTDGGWTADLRGNQLIFGGKTNSVSQAGQYTFIIAGDPSSSTEPGGDSFGIVRVEPTGRIRGLGSLAEGTKFAQIADSSENGEWPLFLPLYGGKGCAVGWLSFESTDTQDIGGDVYWSKAPMFDTKLYPGGFIVTRQLMGSGYSPPTNGVSILNFVEGRVSFEAAALQQSFSDQITVDAKNRVTDLSSNKLSLVFKAGDGSFKGRVTDPNDARTESFGGVVIQKQNAGSGYFARDTQSGRVKISE